MNALRVQWDGDLGWLRLASDTASHFRYTLSPLKEWFRLFRQGAPRSSPAARLRSGGNVLAHARTRAEEVPEFVVTAAIYNPLVLTFFEDIKPNLDLLDFVEDLILKATMAVVYGESNCGKTFWVLDLCLQTGLQPSASITNLTMFVCPSRSFPTR